MVFGNLQVSEFLRAELVYAAFRYRPIIGKE